MTADAEPARGLEPAVDEDGADQRLADVGKERGLLTPAAARFAETEDDMGADVPLGGDRRAGLAAHKFGEPHRELALARLRKGLVEVVGDDHPEHPVAQEFETLVGLNATARLRLGREMGERERGELRIPEAVAKPRLEVRKFSLHALVH